jgi:hypothetical protein
MQLDPLTHEYPFLTPYQYASNDPITNIDIDGLEGGSAVGGIIGGGGGVVTAASNMETVIVKATHRAVTTGLAKTVALSSGAKMGLAIKGASMINTAFITKPNVSESTGQKFYQNVNYIAIKPLDFENGQVMASWSKGILDYITTNDPYRFYEKGKSGGREWEGYQVDKEGYLTGAKYDEALGDIALQWGGHAGPGGPKLGRISSVGSALSREGSYTIYQAFKQVGNEIRLYIGKAKDGILARYSSEEAAKLGAKAFAKLDGKIPNAGIALGVEQRIMELNGWAGKGSTRLSNINNATIKKIYLDAADKWLKKNIPSWKTDFKVQ